MDKALIRAKWKPDFWFWSTLAITLVLILFLVYPLVTLFIRAFQSSAGDFTLANFEKFFTHSYYLRGLYNAMFIGVVVTVFSIIIGAPMAYLMAMYRFKGQRMLDIFIIIALLSPPFIGAYSWILLLGRNGFISNMLKVFGVKLPSIYGIPGIIFVLILRFYPYVYIYMKGALKKIDASLIEAAESMGCGPVKKLFTVVLPLILPTILAAAIMVFMSAIGDFGTIMVLGEGAQVLSTMVYKEYINEVGGNSNFASAISLIMGIMTLLFLFAQNYVVNKRSYTMNALKPIRKSNFSKGMGIVAYAAVYAIIIISMIPHVTILVTSFLPVEGKMFKTGFSLASYQTVFSMLGRPIRNTFVYCFIAIVVIVIVSMLVAYAAVRKPNALTHFINGVTMVPYILPGAVLGLTLLISFNTKPLVLIGTSTIIIIALIIRRLPYTLRSATAIMYQLSPSVDEAAISLGCGPVRTFFKVTARLMLPGVFSGAILSWVTILNELSASFMLYNSKTITMSITVYQYVARTEFGTAAALASILTLTTIISLIVFYAVSGDNDMSL